MGMPTALVTPTGVWCSVWMAWERKRGKLAEFNRFLRGTEGAFSRVVGDVEPILKVRYVITLDADTGNVTLEVSGSVNCSVTLTPS